MSRASIDPVARSGERSTPSAAERDELAPRRPLLEVAVFGTVAVLLVIDLIADAGRTSLRHLAVEVAAAAFALAAAVRVWLQWMTTRHALERRVHELGARLRTATEEAERWRAEAREALEGLGSAIDRQCDRWGLTDAERAVALLLLKGLSMKEVAETRGTTERTVRQQANAVYRKAGLAGRAELAAFFLEDLLLPSSRPRPNVIERPPDGG